MDHPPPPVLRVLMSHLALAKDTALLAAEGSTFRAAHSTQSHTGCATRRARKLERFSFDVARVQCGHSHSHQ